MIYAKGKPIVSYNGGDYYKLINVPIDVDWFDKMYNEREVNSALKTG